MTETATDDERRAILDVLVAHSVEATGRKLDPRQFAVLLRGDAGETLGGVIGVILYDWMFVELVYLPEHRRGDGLGARMMRTVEHHAKQAGCRGIWLDTLSFQARPFYEKLGYACVGTLEDYPKGHRQFIMAKTPLVDGEPAAPPGCVVSDQPTAADRRVLDHGLLEIAARIVGLPNRARLDVRILDKAGDVVGGAAARISREWVALDVLVLPPGLRRIGLGSKVLASLEAEARRRGCVAIKLDTFSFQAPDFFAKHGYREYARIADYPTPHDRRFLTKRLDGPV